MRRTNRIKRRIMSMNVKTDTPEKQNVFKKVFNWFKLRIFKK